jgi:hypothetical protein
MENMQMVKPTSQDRDFLATQKLEALIRDREIIAEKIFRLCNLISICQSKQKRKLLLERLRAHSERFERVSNGIGIHKNKN